MTLSYAGFYIVPMQPEHKIPIQDEYNISMNSTENCSDAEVIYFMLYDEKKFKIVVCSSIPKNYNAQTLDLLNAHMKMTRTQDT